jgi:hypothetical protein
MALALEGDGLRCLGRPYRRANSAGVIEHIAD